MKIRCPACGYEHYFTDLELEDESAIFCCNCNSKKPLVEPKTPDGAEKPDYASRGLYKEAILEACKRAIRINPNDATMYNKLGLSYNHLGLHKEAMEACKQSIRIDPNNADAYYDLGIAYDGLSLHKEAIEAYKQAIRIDIDYTSAYNNLAKAYSSLSLYKESIEALKQAIRLKPADADIHFGLGSLYFLIGDKSSALDEHKVLKKLDINLANQLFNLINN